MNYTNHTLATAIIHSNFRLVIRYIYPSPLFFIFFYISSLISNHLKPCDENIMLCIFQLTVETSTGTPKNVKDQKTVSGSQTTIPDSVMVYYACWAIECYHHQKCFHLFQTWVSSFPPDNYKETEKVILLEDLKCYRG